MPMGNSKINWCNGPKIYSNAKQVSRDMSKRGMEIQEKDGNTPTLEERVLWASSWQHIGEKESRNGVVDFGLNQKDGETCFM